MLKSILDLFLLVCLTLSWSCNKSLLALLFPEKEKPAVIYDAVAIHKKVAVIIYNPIIESRDSKRLTQVFNWNNPDTLIRQYIDDVTLSSWGMVQYQVVEKLELDEFPQHLDGFRYNDSSFIDAWTRRVFHETGGSYNKIVDDFDLVRKVESGMIDEVWLFGAPGFSWWESTMVGRDAYWCNSDPVPGVDCNRRFIIMGFNYERGVDCMLEDLGHRIESMMTHVYDSWDLQHLHAWSKFTLYDKIAPGRSQCGNVHFAPNSDKDYDWGNTRPVESYCDDWYTYPQLPGKKKSVTAAEWGNGDMRLHHIWWFRHLPRASGNTDDVLNNWWRYVMNYDEYR